MLQIGEEHPDRNTQFEFINDKPKQFLEAGLPVIFIDAKKKRKYRLRNNPNKISQEHNV